MWLLVLLSQRLINIIAMIFLFFYWLSFFFPQGFRISGNNLLCSVTHLLQSLILHRPITGACMFLSYMAAAKGESLCSCSVVRVTTSLSLLCYVKRLVTNIAHSITMSFEGDLQFIEIININGSVNLRKAHTFFFCLVISQRNLVFK